MQFVKIEGQEDWLLMLTRNDESDKITKQLADRSKDIMMQRMIYKPGELFDEIMVTDYVVRFSNQLYMTLWEGHTVLINKRCGYRLKTPETKILETRLENDFKLWRGLTGWLSPKAEFHVCKWGDHYVLAQSLVTAGLAEKGWISMGSNLYDDSHSYVHMPETKEQVKWFKDNYDRFDNNQRNQVDEHIKEWEDDSNA